MCYDRTEALYEYHLFKNFRWTGIDVLKVLCFLSSTTHYTSRRSGSWYVLLRVACGCAAAATRSTDIKVSFNQTETSSDRACCVIQP
jgi:hypothetical protein